MRVKSNPFFSLPCFSVHCQLRCCFSSCIVIIGCLHVWLYRTDETLFQSFTPQCGHASLWLDDQQLFPCIVSDSRRVTDGWLEVMHFPVNLSTQMLSKDIFTLQMFCQPSVKYSSELHNTSFKMYINIWWAVFYFSSAKNREKQISVVSRPVRFTFVFFSAL